MSYYTLKDGEKLYYEDVGHGADTLIMMHGWTSSHEVYEKPVETLREYARCTKSPWKRCGNTPDASSMITGATAGAKRRTGESPPWKRSQAI